MARTSSPSRAKSADRIEGAIRTGRCMRRFLTGRLGARNTGNARIAWPGRDLGLWSDSESDDFRDADDDHEGERRRMSRMSRRGIYVLATFAAGIAMTLSLDLGPARARSEERRVGKECRGGRSAVSCNQARDAASLR